MYRFRIPEEEVQHFKDLAQLEKQDQKNFIKSLSDAPLGCWGDELSKFISKNTNIEFNKVRDIVDLLFILNLNKRSIKIGLDEFLDEILLAIKEHKDQELIANNELKDLLKQLLSINTIKLTAKAHELENDREKLFIDTRILTDIRPIFDDDNIENINANLIIHNLKIQFKDSKGYGEIYLALDDEDLSKLKEQIIRAEKKEKRINQGINDIKIIKLKSKE